MTKIEMIISQLNSMLSELNELKSLNYTEGQEKLDILKSRFKSLLKRFFDDWEQRSKRCDSTSFMANSEQQIEYLDCIKYVRREVFAAIEELKVQEEFGEDFKSSKEAISGKMSGPILNLQDASNNTINIEAGQIANSNVREQHKKTQHNSYGSALPTDSFFENHMINFGRWLFNLGKVWGSLLSIFPTLNSILVFLDWFTLYVIFNFGERINFLFRFLGVLWIFTIIALIFLYQQRKCKKCGKALAIRKTDRRKMNVTEYHGSNVYEIVETYKCDYCDNKFTQEFIEESSG